MPIPTQFSSFCSWSSTASCLTETDKKETSRDAHTSTTQEAAGPLH